MFTIKNKQTGEVVNVSNTLVRDGQIIGRYQFTTRYFNKYYMLAKIGDTADNLPILALSEDWEIIKAARPRGEKAPKAPEKTPEVVDIPAEYVVEEQPEVVDTPKAEPAATVIPGQAEVVNAFAALTPLFAGVQANVEQAIMAKVQPILDRAPVRHIHVLNTADAKKELDGEVFHPNFDKVMNRVNAGQWIYLYGPTGSGKNVMAEQIARALNLDFYYQAHVTDRFELTGFIDANGNYHETEFYKAVTKGGVLMVDELDGSDENAIITLNSCSNGYFAFPCGTIKVHPNFRIIAAGNTCGRGATDEYTGRRVMDASTLGRFVPCYHGYDRAIDLHDAQGDESLVEFIQTLREVKAATGVELLCSPRQIKAIKLSESLGENMADALGDIFGTYLTKDDLAVIQREVSNRIPDNSWAKKFSKVKKEQVW